MTNTGTITQTDSGLQMRLITLAGLNTASGNSQQFQLEPYSNATFAVQGTFGSGTFKLQGSWDGGTTWIDAKDVLGNAITLTSNGYFQLGPVAPLLQVVWSGATSPSVTAYVNLYRTFF